MNIDSDREAGGGGGRQPRHRAGDRARLCRSRGRRVDLRPRRRGACRRRARTSPGTAILCMPRPATSPTRRPFPRYIEAAAGALGGIDILVNNASGFGSSDDEAGWAASIAVDLMATVRATRAALPHLEKSDCGSDHQHLVDLGVSRLGAHPALWRGQGGDPRIYPDDGGAVRAQGHPRQLHRSRLDRVSRRHLGAREEQQSATLYGAILRSIPFGRLGQPEEVARVALFLASPLAGWVTGQNIAVDGGQML